MNTQSARKVKEFATVVGRKDGQVTCVRVPGRNGRKYEVSLSRNGGLLKVTCRQVGSMQIPREKFKTWDCQGNSRSLCYHAIAAVEVAAEEAGCQVHGWACTPEKARNLTNLYDGSTVVTVTSAQSGVKKYLVCTKSDPVRVKAQRYIELYNTLSPKEQLGNAEYRELDLFFGFKNWNYSAVLLCAETGKNAQTEQAEKKAAREKLARNRELLRGDDRDQEGI